MLRADRAQRVDDAGVAVVSPDPRRDRIAVGVRREHKWRLAKTSSSVPGTMTAA
jgi:hypothetical protein